MATRDPLRPKPEDTLRSYIRVQEDFDREMYKTLKRSASSIERDILALIGKKNIGSEIKLDQLRAVQKEIHQQLAGILKDAGLTVAAGREAAAAAAIQTMGAYDKLLFDAAHIPADFQNAYMLSAQATARSGVTAAVRRMQGESYVPLSQQVYRTQALSNGLVDRFINQALVKGMNARDFAKGVAQYIDPNVSGGVSYAAMRLARTEINNAYHATQAAKMRSTPWVEAAEWNLSGSHPTPDECNDYADSVHYAGGDPGFFKVEDIPPKPHPQCLCFITSADIGEDAFLDKLFAGDFDDHFDSVMKNSGYDDATITESRFLQKPTAVVKDVQADVQAKWEADRKAAQNAALVERSKYAYGTKEYKRYDNQFIKHRAAKYDPENPIYGMPKTAPAKAKAEAVRAAVKKPTTANRVAQPKTVKPPAEAPKKAPKTKIPNKLFPGSRTSMFPKLEKNPANYVAASTYTDGAYSLMQYAIRADRAGIEVDARYAEELKQARHLSKALRTVKTTEDMVVQRGANMGGIFTKNTDFDTLVGKSYIEGGFTSTSTYYRGEVSEKVFSNGFLSGSNIRFNINVPKGTYGADMAPFSKHFNENEFLLPPGTRFTITGVDYIYRADGTIRQRIVNMVVTGQ